MLRNITFSVDALLPAGSIFPVVSMFPLNVMFPVIVFLSRIFDRNIQLFVVNIKLIINIDACM